jgi:hypothetical protein
MYDFHCTLWNFMKVTTQSHYVGIFIHTFTQITREISKAGGRADVVSEEDALFIS